VNVRTGSLGLKLASSQIDLWYVCTDQVSADVALRYHALLTGQELSHHDRFYIKKDRHRYLITRALLREVLSFYLQGNPKDWRFKANLYGKPYLVDSGGLTQLINFNISHSDGLVVLAICRNKELGVDTENTQRKAPIDVAERFFSSSESRHLCSLPREYQAMRFWEIWTLKESYIKARGMGLSLPLDLFSFDLEVPGAIFSVFASSLEDNPLRWQFLQLRPTEDHLLSVCIEAPSTDDPPIQWTIHESVPLVSHRLVHRELNRISAGY
jgi:4'-phosphopantetheinyl transferase